MKNILIIIMVFCGTVQAQKIKSAGMWMNDDAFKGQPMVFGEDEAMQTVLASIEAYNSGDVEKELTFYTKDMQDKNGDFSRQWHAETSMLKMTPWVMIPVKIKGDDRTQVLTWSVEEREWGNGSKQKQNLMEVFVVNKEGKISGFNQWSRNYPTNEFGLAVGGKFFGKTKSDYTGRKLVFSNRGEVEKLEELIAAYNAMDSATCQSFFAENAVVEAADGSMITFTAELWDSVFDPYSSIQWTPYSIVPLKIYNTDPASGVTVIARETRNMKDGTVWDKEMVEQFYFNVEGKITRVVQYEKNVSK